MKKIPDLDRRTFLKVAGTSLEGSGAGRGTASTASGKSTRPNFLLCLTDDQSWMHAGAYGNKSVHTPAFDRVARNGVLFNHAYTACPSCTPSRGALLTGQAIWRLEEGSVFGRTLPVKFDVFPLLLERAGYTIGWTGKGWGPGNLRPGGWGNENPLGPVTNSRYVSPRRFGQHFFSNDYAANFEDFLRARPGNRPFFFWCGIVQPHRPYVKGSGLKAGKKLEDVSVPGHLIDTPELRSDILDYCLEIDYLDTQIDRMLRTLEAAGEIDNTIVVITSDNGIALPRSKGTLYDMGTRMPFAVAWPAEVPAGRASDDFVILADLAPTFLEAAGVRIPGAMTGRSLMKVLQSDKSGLIDPSRDWVVTAIENHGHPYPVRAIRTHRYQYIRNFKPERNPTSSDENLVRYKDHPEYSRFYRLVHGKRPAEELYDMTNDPWQVDNLASDPCHEEAKRILAERLEQHLRDTGDPRMIDGEFPYGDLEMDRRNWGPSTFGEAPRDDV